MSWRPLADQVDEGGDYKAILEQAKQSMRKSGVPRNASNPFRGGGGEGDDDDDSDPKKEGDKKEEDKLQLPERKESRRESFGMKTSVGQFDNKNLV